MSDDPRVARAAGIDYGRSRIGLAIADELAILAHPRPFVPARPPQRALRQLTAFARREGVDLFVVGLPRNMDGSEGASAQRVRDFASKLASSSGIPIAFEDERLSTVEALARLREAGQDARQAKNKVDSAAAALILQGWLDQQGARQ